MSNRHLSRSLVLQTLFEWDVRGYSEGVAQEALKRLHDEFAPGSGTRDDFADMLLEGVLRKQQTIDAIIEKAAPEWPLDRISITDRNILRIGLFELLFFDADEVPPKVAINEAIELAKIFGSENSSRFVNGVLGAVYKELGEPGKDQQSKKKKTFDISKLPVDTLVGAVVYAQKDHETYLALVHDVFGRWTLSKGHLKDNEDEKTGTMRKVEEEMGIETQIEQELGTNQYVASDPERGKILKKVHYFLGKSEYGDLRLGESGGLDDVRWFRLEDITELNFYNDILPIITQAITLLEKKKA